MRPAGGDESEAALLAPLRRRFVPNRFLARVVAGEPRDRLAALVPVVRAKRPREGRATAYVCYDQVCQRPTSEPEVFAQQLEVVAPLPQDPRVMLQKEPASP